jgi:DNA-binding response OmpR family regulator
MKILLVEDDHFKQELIEAALKERYPNSSVSLARSVQQAVKLIRSDEYDLIILDIALPSHDSKAGGAQPISQPAGGIEVLLELSYEERSDPVIIVTQYPEIEFNGRLYALAKARSALTRLISVNIQDVIFFNAQASAWRDQFRKACR